MDKCKVVSLLESLLTEIKKPDPPAVVRPGNRTTAIMNYRSGTNVVQDVVDCLRRAIRVGKGRSGRPLDKKERNIARVAIKALKATGAYGVKNTNGNDVLTQHGA